MTEINMCVALIALVAVAFVAGMIAGAILTRNCDRKKLKGEW